MDEITIFTVVIDLIYIHFTSAFFVEVIFVCALPHLQEASNRRHFCVHGALARIKFQI